LGGQQTGGIGTCCRGELQVPLTQPTTSPSPPVCSAQLPIIQCTLLERGRASYHLQSHCHCIITFFAAGSRSTLQLRVPHTRSSAGHATTSSMPHCLLLTRIAGPISPPHCPKAPPRHVKMHSLTTNVLSLCCFLLLQDLGLHPSYVSPIPPAVPAMPPPAARPRSSFGGGAAAPPRPGGAKPAASSGQKSRPKTTVRPSGGGSGGGGGGRLGTAPYNQVG
jgi:hypothetical protein